MSFRRRILAISVGSTGYLGAGSFLKLFNNEKRPDPPDSHSTRAGEMNKRKIVIDGYDLKMVQVFIRHGARTPLHLIRNVEEVSYPVDLILHTVPHTIFNHVEQDLQGGPRSPSNYELHYLNRYLKGGSKVGALSALGQDQMYMVGRKLRQQYVTEAGLINGDYDPREVLIRSTNVNRTVATARCVMAGMFGKENLNKLPELPIIHVGNAKTDELIPRTTYCPVLRQINHAAMIHGGDAPEIKEDRLRIEKALGIDSHEQKKVNFIDLRDDIVARETHGLPVPEVLLPFREIIENNAAKVMIWAFNGHKDEERHIAMRLSTGPLIKMVIDNMENVNNNKIKMYVYSCHDSTLCGILGLLDIYDFKWPPFGTDVRFELYENEHKERIVRISYDGQDKIVRGCSKELCAFEEFKEAMKPYIIDRKEYQEICESDILERIAKEMMAQEKGEVEDEDDKERSDVPAGM